MGRVNMIVSAPTLVQQQPLAPEIVTATKTLTPTLTPTLTLTAMQTGMLTATRTVIRTAMYHAHNHRRQPKDAQQGAVLVQTPFGTLTALVAGIVGVSHFPKTIQDLMLHLHVMGIAIDQTPHLIVQNALIYNRQF